MQETMPVNYVILKWAREKQNLTLEKVAKRFKKDVSEIQAWESGKKAPTYVQLEKLAYELYKRPIALFCLPEPPKEGPLTESFRTLPAGEIAKISPKLRSIIRKAKAIQIVLQELRGAQNNLINEFSFAGKDSARLIAKKVRADLQISLEEQCSWKSFTEALKKWRAALENQGIFIFKEAFSNQGFFAELSL